MSALTGLFRDTVLSYMDISSAEICRENSWQIGDLLEGEPRMSAIGPLIRLVEIGPFEIAAEILRVGDLDLNSQRDISTSHTGNPVCEMFLTKRKWKRVR